MTGDYEGWWLRCEDVAALIDGEPLTFAWDDGHTWGFRFRGKPVEWDHTADASVGGLESVFGESTGSKIRDAIRKLAGPGFYPAEFTREERSLIKVAVDGLHEGTGWLSGRQLRAKLGDWDRDHFDYAMRRLRPRYFACVTGESEEFRPRLPALFKCDGHEVVERILLKTIEVLRRRYEQNPNVDGYTLDDVLAATALKAADHDFVDNVLSVAALAFPNPVGMNHALGSRRSPHADDVETFRKCTNLRDYARATSKNKESIRPWPTAPLDLLRGTVGIRHKTAASTSVQGLVQEAPPPPPLAAVEPVRSSDMPKTILFLASNPTTDPLALDEEARDIQQKIRASQHRDSLIFKTRWAVRADDLLQALNEDRPTIVHFSGHGDGTPGIVFHAEGGGSQLVDAAALQHLFRVLKDDIRVVVLNACLSIEQARAVAAVVDCVIGMNDSIGDEAARIFAASFYRALGFGRDVKNAFDQGIAALKLAGHEDDEVPVLLVREGVDAERLVLVQRG